MSYVPGSQDSFGQGDLRKKGSLITIIGEEEGPENTGQVALHPFIIGELFKVNET